MRRGRLSYINRWSLNRSVFSSQWTAEMRAKYWNLQTSFNVHIAAAHRYIYLQPYPYFVIVFFNKRTDRNYNGLQKLFPKERWRLEKAYADSTLCTKMPQRIQKTWTTTLEKCYHREGERKKKSHEEEHWNHFWLKLISSVIFFHTLYLFVYFESQAFWRYWKEKKECWRYLVWKAENLACNRTHEKKTC